MKTYLWVAVSLLISSESWAALNCNSTIKNQSVRDDIKAGRNCTLENLIIHGDISVEKNANVILKNNMINGNIVAKKAFSQLNASDNTIQGSIRLESGQLVKLQNNQIKGSIHLHENKGHIFIERNHITGDLVCTKNSFSLQVNKNQIQGTQRDQCQRL